jgi:hypothetical protein
MFAKKPDELVEQASRLALGILPTIADEDRAHAPVSLPISMSFYLEPAARPKR